MDFRILGPLEVVHKGERVPLGGLKQRAVLALLILSSGKVVPAEQLVDRLWGGNPPRTASKTLHAYVSRLRQALGGSQGCSTEVIFTVGPGYRLGSADSEVDATQFGLSVESGRAALADHRPDLASTLLRSALDLWRGPALVDFVDEAFALVDTRQLEEARLVGIELRLVADLACGRHAPLVGEIESLLAVNPWRETLWYDLILALYRCGRQSEALNAFSRLRRMLREKLGIDPCPDLQSLEKLILVQDAILRWHPESLAKVGPPEFSTTGSASAVLRHSLGMQSTAGDAVAAAGSDVASPPSVTEPDLGAAMDVSAAGRSHPGPWHLPDLLGSVHRRATAAATQPSIPTTPTVTPLRVAYTQVGRGSQDGTGQLCGIDVDRTFVEFTASHDAARPQLRAMLSFIRLGDTVVVHSMDRIARDFDELRRIVGELTAKGAEVRFVKEQLTFSGGDEAMTSILWAFAEFERALSCKRTHGGGPHADPTPLDPGGTLTLGMSTINPVTGRGTPLHGTVLPWG